MASSAMVFGLGVTARSATEVTEDAERASHCDARESEGDEERCEGEDEDGEE